MWKWRLELPGPDFSCAVEQPGAADGGETQSDVFFLFGSHNTSCTIPLGEMIFINLMGWEWDNGGFPPEDQLTDDQMKSNLTIANAAVTGLSLQIDGKSYGSTVCDFANYLTVWTQFSYTMPNTPTNYCNAFPGWCTYGYFSGPVPDAFCGGYWILLAPLPAGTHTIHSTMHSDAIPSLGISAIDYDNTYNLTVE